MLVPRHHPHNVHTISLHIRAPLGADPTLDSPPENCRDQPQWDQLIQLLREQSLWLNELACGELESPDELTT